MTQAVSRRILTADARIWSQVSPCGIYGGRSGDRRGFYPGNKVVLCHCHCTNASHSSWSTRLSNQRDKWAKPGNLPEISAVSEIWSIGDKSPLLFPQYLNSYAAICSSDPEVWLLPVSDYVKDRNCFQWKWREFLEKVWPRADGIMLLCAMGSAQAALSVISVLSASLKNTQKHTGFVTLSSLPTVVFGPMYLSVYHLCQLWFLALCICQFIIFSNCGVWLYVFVTLSSLLTVMFGPMYLSVYHLCQMWCLAFCIRRFKIVVQVQEIKLSVTTSVNIGCLFYCML